MAYKIELTENFVATATATSHWIEEKWSFQSALKFQKKLLVVIQAISINPMIGKPSVKEKIFTPCLSRSITAFIIGFQIIPLQFLNCLKPNKIKNSINSINIFASLLSFAILREIKKLHKS